MVERTSVDWFWMSNFGEGLGKWTASKLPILSPNPKF